MQRCAARFTLLYLTLTTASLWGQNPKFPSLPMLSHAEDSQDTVMNNQIFYDGARGPEPQIPEPAGAVSVEQLQHPLSRKGEKLILQAKNFAAKGDHGKAIAELQLALKERSAIPYAYSLLGSEYLKSGQVPDAIDSLEQAVKLLPRNVINHSNLGYALYLRGELERAEKEVRQALDIDRNNKTTRFVLGLVTHARGNGQ